MVPMSIRPKLRRTERIMLHVAWLTIAATVLAFIGGCLRWIPSIVKGGSGAGEAMIFR